MTDWLPRTVAGRKSQHWVAAAYACCLTIALLAPFQFRSPIVHNGARWIAGSGVEFTAPGIIRSQTPTPRLAADLSGGAGFTLEIWAAASGKRLHGPARIVSYSLASWNRNFTLGQEALDLVMPLRTTRTNPSGYKPHVRVSDVFASTALQHIVVTYDFVQQRVFVDGRRRLRTAIPGGDFANWDPQQYLLLGNEATGDAPWLGKLLWVAVYNRVLSDRQIERHFKAGPKPVSQDDLKKDRVIALYRFAGRPESRISDSSGATPPLDLCKPDYLVQGSNDFLLWPLSESPFRGYERIDVVANVLLFLPLGFLLYAELVRRAYGKWTSVAVALALGALVSLAFESTQYFLPGRTSSLLDVLMNASGTALGIAFRALFSPLAGKARFHA